MRYKLIAFILFLLLAQSVMLWADGGYISFDYQDIWEPRQVAMLKYHSATQEEELIIYPKFEGKTKNFCWLIPLPAVPELSPEDKILFNDLSWWTEPIIREKKPECGCGVGATDYRDTAANGGIDIYDEQQIGYYQTITVGADSSAVLIDSLRSWGYFTDDNATHYQPVLDWYINKDREWIFVAIRIDTTMALEEDNNGNWYGNLEPMKFTFDSESLIYPFKISSISTKDENMLLLYVIADHRMTFEGAATEFADHIDNDEINQINTYNYLKKYVEEGDYITKLRRTYTASEMTDDITLERARSDEEYREVVYSGIPLEMIIFLFTFIWLGKRRFKIKK